MKPTAFGAPLAAALCLFAPALATPALAHDFTIGTLSVGHPFAYETPVTAQTGAGYLTITNTGDTPDRLLEVRAKFPRVEVHTTEMKDGIARMLHVEVIEIAPGATVTLAPGGYHVMFMGLQGDAFEVGEKIAATLVFETAGTLDVEFNVEARPAGGAPAMDHSSHGTGATN